MSSERQRLEVSHNYDTFLAEFPELVKKYAGQFALYRDQKRVGVFRTFSDAIGHGIKTYDDRLFSVQEITDEPEDLGGLMDFA